MNDIDLEAIQRELDADPSRREELEDLLNRLRDRAPDGEASLRVWAKAEGRPDPIQARRVMSNDDRNSVPSTER